MARSCRMLAIAALTLISSCAHLEQSKESTEGWGEEEVVIQTKYTAIKAKPSHLSRIKRCLEVKNIEEVDVLYEKVFNFLKKRLGDKKAVLNPVRVGVRIYASKSRLQEVYKSLGGKCPEVKGFYAAWAGEVHSSLWDLSWWHLAHEFAHHILKKEFGLNLPKETEEKLVRCVEEFL